MIKNADELLKNADQLIDEIDAYAHYKANFLSSLKKAKDSYQRKKYDYLEYHNILANILKGKTKGEWTAYYDSITYSLLKKIDFLLLELYNEVLEDSIDIQNAPQASKSVEEKKDAAERTHERIDELRPKEAKKEAKEGAQSAAGRGYERGYIQQSLLHASRKQEEDMTERLNIVRAKLSGRKPVYSHESLKYVLVRKPEHLRIHLALKTPKSEEAQESEVVLEQLKQEEFEIPKLSEDGKGMLRAYPEVEKAAMQGQEAQQGAWKKIAFFKFPEIKLPESFINLFRIGIRSVAALPQKLMSMPSKTLLLIFKKKGEKEVLHVEVPEEIDFSAIAGKPKAKKQNEITAQKMEEELPEPAQAAQAHPANMLLKNIRKKAAAAGAASLKIPRGLGAFALFTAKLPLNLTVRTIKISFNAVKLVSSIKRRKPQPRAAGKKAKGEKPSLLDRVKGIFSRPKSGTIFVEEIVEIEKAAQKQKPETAKLPRRAVKVFTGGILDMKFFRDLVKRFGAKEEKILGEQTEIPERIKKLRQMRERLREEESEYAYERTILAKEARRVKEILEAERVEVYKGTSVGAFANFFVKRTSVSLVDAFPEIFEQLYNALRSANIKVLSNTYISIMVFFSIAMFLGVTSALSVIFFILNYPLYHILFSSFLFGFVAAALTAVFFYAYPFMKIGDRKRNITTNLPFAINHLAAVSASGVPPGSMFELISDSKEYGEIAVEFKKIVELMNIFGYDLLTAIRTVSSNTPSPAFKEILEGMVSTIETGGDLESYLREKADEATLTYKLERQKYNESISTYSDIYTGLLIAAPLFFVSALASISLLGGTIGGFGIEFIMAFGTYVAVPLLNIAFLLFLQVNQPEV